MTKRSAAAVCLALALTLTGCGSRSWLPYAREMGDMALLRTLGLDGGPGAVELTASTGARVSGMSAQQQEALVLSAEGDSISQACLAVQSLSSETVFFGYVDQLLLGEELARTDVMQALNYLAGEVELGLGAQMWVVQGASARDAIQSAGEEVSAQRLAQLQADSELGVAELTRTAGELLTALENGTSTYLPALTLAQAQEGDGGEDAERVLAQAGYGILRQGRLVCFVQGDAARGLELLEGQVPAQVLVLHLEDGTSASLRVTASKVSCTPAFQDGRVTGLVIHSWLNARVIESDRAMDQKDVVQLCRLLEEQEGAGMVRALALAQYWDADFLDLMRQAGLAAPDRWEQLQEQWSAAFRSLEIQVEVVGAVEREFGLFG